jgi:hypothetical protein
MPSNAVASTHEVAKRAIAQWTDSTGRTSVSGGPAESTDSLFERVAWLYAFCRERLFRDDTDRIISALWQTRAPASGTRVIEPRHAFWASIPLMAIWLLASVIHSGNGYREPRKATVLKTEAFGELFQQLPWKSVRIWQDGRYQYAVCEKS